MFYVKLDVKDLKKGKLFLLDKIAEEKSYDTCSVKDKEFYNVTHKNIPWVPEDFFSYR